MLGDELLVAPIYEGKVRVTVPNDNMDAARQSRIPGRRVITTEGKPAEMVLPSRNGSILLGWGQ